MLQLETGNYWAQLGTEDLKKPVKVLAGKWVILLSLKLSNQKLFKKG